MDYLNLLGETKCERCIVIDTNIRFLEGDVMIIKIILAVIIFNLGFLTGAWWSSRGEKDA